MPFKSKAQRRKFAELLMKGEISPETYEEWNRETGSATLPERVEKSAKRRATRAGKPTRRTKTATSAKARPKARPTRGAQRRSK